MADLESKLRPPLEALLEPGETLQGACVCTQVGMFKGRMVGIGVTEGRLMLQGFNRKWEPDGEATSLTPDLIADVSADGLSEGWPNLAAAVVDRAGVTLKLRTTDGEKLKLMMMRGGEGLLGGLGGGETQGEGVRALGEWFDRHAASV